MLFVKSLFSFAAILFFMIIFSENTSAQSCCSSNADAKKAQQHKMMKSKMESTKHDHSSDSTKTEEASLIWNKYCPVLGNEVDPATETVDYNGKKIGFCCPGCIKKFNKDPERYIKNLSEDGTEFIAKK